MDTTANPAFCTYYTLQHCITRCKPIDEARRKIFSNPNYLACFDVCNETVLKLVKGFRIEERTACHALVLSQVFISLEGPSVHKTISSDCPFNAFWTCVAMICFSTCVGFNDVAWPNIIDMTKVVGLTYSDYAKSFYKRVQLKFLMTTQWSLYFPTGNVSIFSLQF